MPNDSPSPRPEDWMIYPGVRQAVRICALAFCAGIVLTVLHHLLMPVLFHLPDSAAWSVPAALLAEIVTIISLSVLVAWGARALLASRGSYVTRTLSFLMVFPALYAALLLLSASPAAVRLIAADTVLETTFLLAAATAFFFPAVHKRLSGRLEEAFPGLGRSRGMLCPPRSPDRSGHVTLDEPGGQAYAVPAGNTHGALLRAGTGPVPFFRPSGVGIVPSRAPDRLHA